MMRVSCTRAAARRSRPSRGARTWTTPITAFVARQPAQIRKAATRGHPREARYFRLTLGAGARGNWRSAERDRPTTRARQSPSRAEPSRPPSAGPPDPDGRGAMSDFRVRYHAVDDPTGHPGSAVTRRAPVADNSSAIRRPPAGWRRTVTARPRPAAIPAVRRSATSVRCLPVTDSRPTPSAPIRSGRVGGRQACGRCRVGLSALVNCGRAVAARCASVGERPLAAVAVVQPIWMEASNSSRAARSCGEVSGK